MRVKGPGEDLVAEDLKERGYRILAQNYWRKGKEIDIIASGQGQVVAVEVKYRSSSRYPARLSITPKKLSHIFQVFNSFLAENPKFSRFEFKLLLAEVSPDGNITYTEVDPHGW
jgi:putative endonuclease